MHQAERDRRRTTIAVIDDDARLATLVKTVLEEASNEYRVEIQPEVGLGYAFIQELEPQVIFLDMMMGVEEVGFDTLEQLSDDGVLCHVPVIVSTAGLFPAERYSSLRSPISHLPKPFRLEELLAAVESALQTSRTSASA